MGWTDTLRVCSQADRCSQMIEHCAQFSRAGPQMCADARRGLSKVCMAPGETKASCCVSCRVMFRSSIGFVCATHGFGTVHNIFVSRPDQPCTVGYSLGVFSFPVAGVSPIYVVLFRQCCACLSTPNFFHAAAAHALSSWDPFGLASVSSAQAPASFWSISRTLARCQGSLAVSADTFRELSLSTCRFLLIDDVGFLERVLWCIAVSIHFPTTCCSSVCEEAPHLLQQRLTRKVAFLKSHLRFRGLFQQNVSERLFHVRFLADTFSTICTVTRPFELSNAKIRKQPKKTRDTECSNAPRCASLGTGVPLTVSVCP